MRMKSNLKKILSVVLAASVVATTSALAGLAANGTDTAAETVSGLNLMPAPGVTDWSGVTDMGRDSSKGEAPTPSP